MGGEGLRPSRPGTDSPNPPPASPDPGDEATDLRSGGQEEATVTAIRRRPSPHGCHPQRKREEEEEKGPAAAILAAARASGSLLRRRRGRSLRLGMGGTARVARESDAGAWAGLLL